MKTKKENVSRKQRVSIWISLLIALIVGAAYANSLQAPFVFDDNNHIRDNPRIQKLWPIMNVISRTNRPVVDLTLAVNYRLGKRAVAGYHIFNLAIHIFNALLVMLIVKGTLSVLSSKGFNEKRADMLSFFIALLWALHPIQTQSVTYIIQRSELLMGLFYLLTLYSVLRLHGKPKVKGWGIAAILFCALGMGCKEVMVTAPIVILLYDRIFLSVSFKEMLKKRGWIYLGLFATWILLYKFATIDRSNAAIGGFSFNLVSPWEYAVSQPKVICHYIKLMFWPKGLCLDYQWPLVKTALDIVPYSLIILLLILTAGWALRYRMAWGFLGVWFFFILGPTSSFMPVGDLAFDHRMYLSSLSIIILFVLGSDWLLRRFKELPQAVIGPGGGMLVVAVLLILTVQRNAVYLDGEVLWRDVLDKRPENMRVYMNLGVALMRKDKQIEAEKYLLKALDFNPGNEKAHHNLAFIMEQRGDSFQAQKHLKEAIRIRPDFFHAHLLLGRIFLDKNEFSQAEQYLKKAVAIESKNALAHLALGFLFYKTERLDEAMGQYDLALQIDPGNTEAYYQAALVLAQKGDLDKAAQYLTEVTNKNPANALAHFNLGNILAQKGDYQSALSYFQECLQLKPEFTPVLQRIGQVQNLFQNNLNLNKKEP